MTSFGVPSFGVPSFGAYVSCPGLLVGRVLRFYEFRCVTIGLGVTCLGLMGISSAERCQSLLELWVCPGVGFLGPVEGQCISYSSRQPPLALRFAEAFTYFQCSHYFQSSDVLYGGFETDSMWLQVCTRCAEAWYCSKECQAQAWRGHKKECKRIAAKNSEQAV